MNRHRSHMQNQIVDYVLGALGARQAKNLKNHLAHCQACRAYGSALSEQAQSLAALGRQIDAGMKAREDNVIRVNSA